MATPPTDAAELANLAVRAGIVNPGQVQEAWDELGTRHASAEDLVRILERKGHLSPYQSAKLQKGEPDGYVMGGYRLRYKVGSGIFGQIFRADDPSTGQVVALKVLRPEWHDDRRKIELFLREGRMGMTLRHPNIVEILAVDQDHATGRPYIVMEFVEGGDLRALLAIRKRLAAGDVLRILEESASALAYAFARGVTHRDMKVTNILLSSQGPAKLADFGLAGVQASSGEKDKVKRTQDYAGLEKATGAPAGDARSDIFFLGCVAYELLTGRRPLERAHTSAARQAAQRFVNIPPIRPEETDAPPSVLHLVEAMMVLDPADRIQTPAQLLDRVRAVRRELEGPATRAAAARTLFVVEGDERLQERLRDKLKKAGYRVLIATDPQRALDRFRAQPFDLFLVNGGTTGAEGCEVFARVLDEARRRQACLGGVLIVRPEQTGWQDRLANERNVAVLVLPVQSQQLLQAIRTVASKDSG